MEFSTVQAFTGLVVEAITELGLDLSVRDDFQAFAAFRRSVADGLVYPTFDPDSSRLGEGAFWLCASEPGGRIVATYALRVFQAHDFFDLVRTEALWRDRAPRLVHPGVPVNCPLPPFGGVVGHAGGMWVHPDHRGRGLSTLLPCLGRALMLRNHAIDHDTGVVSGALYRKGLGVTAYRYARVVPCVDAYTGFAGCPEPVYLCHVTRAEALSMMRQPGPVLAAAPVPAAA